MAHIILEKKSSTGKPLIWEGLVEGNKIIVKHGQVGGKIQTKETIISEGKNLGRSNETTPEQQALIELESTARSKVEKDYEITNGYKLTTVNEKQIKVQNKEIPSPMLAHPHEKHISKVEGKKIRYQAKIDGFRTVYSVEGNAFYSRSRKPLIGCPEILRELSYIQEELNTLGISYLDGELYTDKLTFEQISSVVSPRKTLAHINQRELVEYHVFDYIDTEKTFDERWEVIEALSRIIENKNLKTIKIVKTFSTFVEKFETTLKPIVESMIFMGYEGIMLRLPDSLYENKRSYGIFKYKLFQDCEARCVGFVCEKNNGAKLGSIKFALPNGNEFEARPAMTEEQREEIFTNQDYYLGRIGVIKYQELTEYDVPRFPVFTGKWREGWDLGEEVVTVIE